MEQKWLVEARAYAVIPVKTGIQSGAQLDTGVRRCDGAFGWAHPALSPYFILH
jgi:hypothetical protein